MVNFKNCTTNNFSNGLRDDMLQFQLDNELAASLIVSHIGEKISVQLLSKTGGIIGNPALFDALGDNLKEAKLEEKYINLYLTSGSVIKCNLDSLYSKIDDKAAELDAKKQNNLTAGSNIVIDTTDALNPVISVKDLPAFPTESCRYMLVADYNATTSKWEYCWRKCPNVAYWE